ncbi:MAG: Na(+)-translocating NADH-quinone reductase subunit A [Deltaproteobacteria bacterium]|nr:Na(+)-translocating NADH-quinone reductase subunit A [Deltaproteobacteria bacterium]MBN2674196.1 Na(+)-translocating NADH-quinone reductase subunit A [Deltaproteobacteria bacterium]
MGNTSPTKHKAKRGLDLPISGKPTNKEIEPISTATVALLADDYVGMRPSMKVKVGDVVKRGQVLFEDRKNPGVLFTSPGAGTVSAINRGERRAFQSVVVDLSDADGTDDGEATYSSFNEIGGSTPSRAQLVQLMVESGMWTALRGRPFSKVPSPESTPAAIFVTAMDSNPLAPLPENIIKGNEKHMDAGLSALQVLADGKPVHLCKADGAKLGIENLHGATVHEFSGKHPAGTVGFHIHRIMPVDRKRTAWYLGYQDVIALGALVQTGKLHLERVVSVAGPGAKSPKLVKTRLGACVGKLVDDQRKGNHVEVLSGSVFNGRSAVGAVHGYIGRYHNQITLLENDDSRRFLGWLAPGFNRFSVTRLFGAAITPGKKFDFTTDRFGGHRTPVPFGSYDKVMAFDLLPVFLLRSLLSKDLETAEQLGALELDEEDVALLTFVCPSKNEYGEALRDVLTQIEKEG